MVALAVIAVVVTNSNSLTNALYLYSWWWFLVLRVSPKTHVVVCQPNDACATTKASYSEVGRCELHSGGIKIAQLWAYSSSTNIHRQITLYHGGSNSLLSWGWWRVLRGVRWYNCVLANGSFDRFEVSEYPLRRVDIQPHTWLLIFSSILIRHFISKSVLEIYKTTISYVDYLYLSSYDCFLKYVYRHSN